MDNQTRFFLYARKSTDEEGRQVLSIEAQLFELREFARKENILLVGEFVESCTAKEPGRPIFNDMVARIEEGEAEGILSWHPDRLARNSIDGGRIIYLVDTGKLRQLKFNVFWFDPTPQGKFMLSIAFGQSKYYVDNLSENIRRGIRQKLRNGIWPGSSPIGYLNDKNLRCIVVDPNRAPFVRRAFELYASGDYPFYEIRKIINEAGLVGKSGRLLSVSDYQHMLKNRAYYGLIVHKGELYEGKHEPLVAKQLFDQVQEVMKKRSKAKTSTLKPYLYRGLFSCGACGCTITTETQKGHNYLRCTKRKALCSQPYVREEIITSQIQAEIKKVALPSAWANWLVTEVEKERTGIAQAEAASHQKLKDKLRMSSEKLDLLLDALLSKALSQEEYVAKKSNLVNEKIELQQQLSAFGAKQNNRFELMLAFIRSANQATEIASGENLETTRDFLKTIGSNPTIAARTLSVPFKNPWQILAKYKMASRSDTTLHPNSSNLAVLRRERDSNSRTLAGWRFSKPLH